MPKMEPPASITEQVSIGIWSNLHASVGNGLTRMEEELQKNVEGRKVKTAKLLLLRIEEPRVHGIDILAALGGRCVLTPLKQPHTGPGPHYIIYPIIWGVAPPEDPLQPAHGVLRLLVGYTEFVSVPIPADDFIWMSKYPAAAPAMALGDRSSPMKELYHTQNRYPWRSTVLVEDEMMSGEKVRISIKLPHRLPLAQLTRMILEVRVQPPAGAAYTMSYSMIKVNQYNPQKEIDVFRALASLKVRSTDDFGFDRSSGDSKLALPEDDDEASLKTMMSPQIRRFMDRIGPMVASLPSGVGAVYRPWRMGGAYETILSQGFISGLVKAKSKYPQDRLPIHEGGSQVLAGALIGAEIKALHPQDQAMKALDLKLLTWTDKAVPVENLPPAVLSRGLEESEESDDPENKSKPGLVRSITRAKSVKKITGPPAKKMKSMLYKAHSQKSERDQGDADCEGDMTARPMMISRGEKMIRDLPKDMKVHQTCLSSSIWIPKLPPKKWSTFFVGGSSETQKVLTALRSSGIFKFDASFIPFYDCFMETHKFFSTPQKQSGGASPTAPEQVTGDISFAPLVWIDPREQLKSQEQDGHGSKLTGSFYSVIDSFAKVLTIRKDTEGHVSVVEEEVSEGVLPEEEESVYEASEDDEPEMNEAPVETEKTEAPVETEKTDAEAPIEAEKVEAPETEAPVDAEPSEAAPVEAENTEAPVEAEKIETLTEAPVETAIEATEADTPVETEKTESPIDSEKTEAPAKIAADIQKDGENAKDNDEDEAGDVADEDDVTDSFDHVEKLDQEEEPPTQDATKDVDTKPEPAEAETVTEEASRPIRLEPGP